MNPDIANALRDINDRIGDDFESSIADFQYTASEPGSPDDGDGSGRFSGAGSAMVRRVMGGVLFAGAGVAALIFAGPTIATWLGGDTPPAALALFDSSEPAQRLVVDGETMYLEGVVPDQNASDALESAAVAVVGRDRVVNNFEINPEAVYDPNAPIELSVAQPVLFNTGAATLDEQYKPLIDLAVDLMNAEPTSTLSISGHTDDVGSDDANLRLSMSRAEAVGELITNHGIDQDRLTIEGLGESHPIETNETPEGRAINRRVEFSILGVFGS